MAGYGQRIRFLLFLCGAAACLPAPAEDFQDWAHSAILHLNTTSKGANLAKAVADFPLLVRITDPRILSQAQSNGGDLRFATEDGTPLDFQIERWSTGAGKGEAWVRMPSIEAGSDKQRIRVYWGNAAAPWISDGSKAFPRSAGFHAVYHLGEGGTQARANAAGNWNHGTPKNYDGDERVEGMIGMADSLDGYSFGGFGGDYLDLGQGFDTLQDFSFSVWARCGIGYFSEKLIVLGNGQWNDEFSLGRVFQTDTLRAFFIRGAKSPMSPVSELQGVAAAKGIVLGEWAHYGVTLQGGKATLYRNGAALASATLPQAMAAVKRTANFLGHSGWSGGYDFMGVLDEAQLRRAATGPEWMALAYESQRPDSKLITWEFPPATPLAITAQPEGAEVEEGGAFMLSVSAVGGGTLRYQWLKEGKELAGATAAVFAVSGVTLADAGLYACRVSDSQDTLLTRAVAVIVPEDLSAWAHCRPILLDAGAEGASPAAPVANLPVLIRLGKGNFDFSQVAAGGKDLRFADRAGTPLAHAIERWAADTAEVWVRLPIALGGGRDTLRMYWGKSAARQASSPASVFSINDNWRAYYAFSDPLGGPAGAQVEDATLNGYRAQASGASAVDGPIGKAASFSGASASHAQAPQAATEGLAAYTVLAWVRTSSSARGGSVFAHPHLFGTSQAVSGQGEFGVYAEDGALGAWVGVPTTPQYNSSTTQAKLNDGAWHLAAVSASGTTFSVYLDGAKALTLSAQALPLAANVLSLGGLRSAEGTWGAPFAGDLDAVQIAGEAKSADWIRFAYAAQRPGSALAVFLPEADPGPPIPRIDPPGGAFEASVPVVLSSPADGVRIYYTLDGTRPDTAARGSTRLYSAPVRVSESGELRALAYRAGVASAVERAEFRIFALPESGDTLAPGGSRAVDGLRRVTYPNQDAKALVLLMPGPKWSPHPAGFERIGELFHVLPLETASAFPGLAVEGDSLEGLSLYRRDANGVILWMTPKDGQLWIPTSGTYFWARDTLPPRVRLDSAGPHGNDSVSIRIIVEDNVGALQGKIRFGRAEPDSFGWWPAPSGEKLSFTVPVPADPGTPLEAHFSVGDHSRETRFPPQGWITLPRPVPSVSAPLKLKPGHQWKLAGMPLAAGLSLSLNELAERSGTGPLVAAVWKGETPPDSGYRILQGDDTLPGGKGFWIASEDGAPTLNFPAARAVASDSGGLFPIPLRKGWNLVTCPSLRPLAWPVSVRDGDAYLASGLKPLQAYGETGYTRPDSLRPWQAYYVRSDRDTVVRVGEGAPRAAAPPARRAAGPGRLGLELRGAGSSLSLGASPVASDALGIEDEARPPAPAEAAAAWLARGSRALAVDYVAWEPGRAMSWTVAAPSLPQGSALAVEGASLPPGFEAWAVSPARRLKWPLVEGGNIPVTEADTLRIYAGTAAALSRVPELAGGRAAPGAFSARLRAAAAGLELALDLPGEAAAAYRLLDARGRALGRGSHRLAAGYHLLPIAGPLRSGAYWLDLRVEGREGTVRKVLPAGFLR